MWSLGQFYALVPDAYELDLIEEAREGHVDVDPWVLMGDVAMLIDELRGEVDVERIEVVGGPPLVAEPDEIESDPESPSLTQAQFMVERLLGGEIVES